MPRGLEHNSVVNVQQRDPFHTVLPINLAYVLKTPLHHVLLRGLTNVM